jgi:predicted HAD superfamily phosphohydrolase YqeG
MVGDQYWTDVAGANMAGVRSIRVPPVEPGTFPTTLRVLQSVEQRLRRWIG